MFGHLVRSWKVGWVKKFSAPFCTSGFFCLWLLDIYLRQMHKHIIKNTIVIVSLTLSYSQRHNIFTWCSLLYTCINQRIDVSSPCILLSIFQVYLCQWVWNVEDIPSPVSISLIQGQKFYNKPSFIDSFGEFLWDK